MIVLNFKNLSDIAYFVRGIICLCQGTYMGKSSSLKYVPNCDSIFMYPLIIHH